MIVPLCFFLHAIFFFGLFVICSLSQFPFHYIINSSFPSDKKYLSLHPAVRKFKVVVVVVLVAAAVAVSAVVYRFTSNGERQNLSTEYDDYAAKFITNFHHLAVMRQWAAYSVAALYTAKVIDNYGPGEKPWPNATLPDFHDQVRGLLVLAHSQGIEFSPFFPNNDTVRSEWEAYAVENEVSVIMCVECIQSSLFIRMMVQCYYYCL